MTTKTLHPKPARAKTERLRVSDINVDRAYQRRLVASSVKRIVDEFDPADLGVIHVSRRADGTLWVIDGQHRLAALMRLGWADRTVKCEVYDGLSPADEAGRFHGLNSSRKVRAFDDFRSLVVSGDIAASAINKTCEKYGLILSDQAIDGRITCVAAMRRVYEGHGIRNGHIDHLTELDSTLDVITKAWGRTADAVNGNIVQGIGYLFLRNGSDVDKAHLVKVLAGHPGGPVGLLGKARGVREFNGGALYLAVAETVTNIYNKGRRTNRLPDLRRA